MGLLFSDVKALYRAKQSGVSFDSLLTIGRQSLFLHPKDVSYFREIASSRRMSGSSLDGYVFGDYADDFLREFLEVRSLSVLDNSPYEGADLIHDLNEPMSEDLRNGFDVVVDAGSLEHVFNFPVAVASLMSMTKVGGKVFITTPANNLCGHGFYQFSPELMFRIFSESNGFDIESVTLLPTRFPGVEVSPMRTGYEVTDPAEVRGRVGLVSRTPAMMRVAATKTQDKIPFSEAPQQSDYELMWKGETKRSSAGKEVLKAAFQRLPHSLRNRITGHYQRVHNSFLNRSFYRKTKL